MIRQPMTAADAEAIVFWEHTWGFLACALAVALTGALVFILGFSNVSVAG